MYSPLGRSEGGAESVFRRVATGLERRGHRVIRVFNNYDLAAGAYRKVEGEWGISIAAPPTWKSCFRPSYAWRFCRSFSGLRRLLREVDPDVVNYHFLTPSAIHFAVLKALFSYRLVISCHGSDVTDLKALNRRLSPVVLSQADAVTCVSRFLARSLQEQVPSSPEPEVIYNGIDFSYWKQEATSCRDSLKNVVSVGALKSVKGHDVLIRAFADVVDVHPTAHLILAGDGPKRDEYENLTNSLGLNDHIRFAGWQDANGVRTLLGGASLFVFPSRNEGFGIALLEAMAAGLPVVASNVGGIPEVVHGANALLVPPRSPSALAEAISKGLADDEWRKNAVQQSKEKAAIFDWDHAITQYERVLVE